MKNDWGYDYERFCTLEMIDIRETGVFYWFCVSVLPLTNPFPRSRSLDSRITIIYIPTSVFSPMSCRQAHYRLYKQNCLFSGVCSWQGGWAAYIISRLTRVIWQRNQDIHQCDYIPPQTWLGLVSRGVNKISRKFSLFIIIIINSFHKVFIIIKFS